MRTEDLAMLKRGFTLMLLFFAVMLASAPWASSQEEAQGQVPAFNAGPPAKGTKLPALLTKDQLWAAKIPNVIHQQPCYCYCDRMGHKSLHSCFEGTHGAQCATCLKELYYSYTQHQKGRTAAQIRKGIIAGEWKQVNLETAASIN
jgi:hypothetical protein